MHAAGCHRRTGATDSSSGRAVMTTRIPRSTTLCASACVPRPSARTRALLEMQGFTGLDDRTVQHVHSWLRLAPALCGTWAAAATATGSTAALWALVPFAALGAILSNHPFDALYNHGARRLTGGPPLPRYGAPRRFACLTATALLVGSATAIETGHETLGTALGWTLVAGASVLVSTGFCVPSFLYRLAVRGAHIVRNPWTAEYELPGVNERVS